MNTKMIWLNLKGMISYSIRITLLFFTFVVVGNIKFSNGQTSTQSACYDKNGIAKTCLTYPKNVALNRNILATNTCGTPSETFCQIGGTQDSRCKICNAGSQQNSYPAKNMVDFHNPTNITWWQSSSWWQMKLKGQATLANPPKVNVTINFKKLYLVSGGVRVTFYSVRPKKVVIQRSKDYGNTWTNYQFFAKNCRDSYGLVADPVINATNRFHATCTQRFSSELPYVGGMVVFDTRLIRYQNNEYLDPNVQNYLSATDIRLLLEYPGTDGRENIDSASTLNQYYYAISDIVVDARCHCHGHAEYCDFNNGTEACDCKHFTTGKDCEQCLPLYNNRKWMAGNETDPNVCKECQCYSHASSCVYNQQLGYGICQNCKHNTTGSSCELCVDKFYRNVSKPLFDVNVCIPCDCFMFGVQDNGSCLQIASNSQQLGQCNCKPGVYGRRCDQCVPGKWGFAIQPIGACFDCLCNFYGTVGSNQTCDPYSGQCHCKPNAQGRACSECKDSFYSFPTNTTADCQPCNCDLAGGFPVCDKSTGLCTCRRGITGRQCSAVSNGFYFPNFTHVAYEVEMLSQQGHEYFWLEKGYKSLFLGIGQIKLRPGHSVVYSFQVPVTYQYIMVIRYSLYPISWHNTLFLYDAESLSWSGASDISTYTSNQDNPLQWNLTVAVSGPSNSQLLSNQFSIGSLSVGEAKTWNESSSTLLSAGLNYRLDLSYLAGSNSGSPWPIVIDSVIFMPDLIQNSYYSTQSPAAKSEIQNCYELSKSLSAAFVLPAQCRKHVFGSSVIMYNGTLACDCFTPGSNNPSTCEQYGGQCGCKPGYGGRRCEHCLPGYYGNPSTGCSACRCSLAGSLTPVCNQTTGNCFCKANTQGSKCENCKPRAFALTASNPDGCQSCYGFGHLVSCAAARQFFNADFVSNFTFGRNAGWVLINSDGSTASSFVQLTSNGLQYTDEGGRVRFLSAPSQYLGNQLNSYGQLFTIEMSFVALSPTIHSRQWHVRLTGGGMTAVFALYPRISTANSVYSFRLHEKFMANSSKLSEFDFKSLIGQLSSIHIGVNYFQSGSVVTFRSIQMGTANSTRRGSSTFASHVENATCLIGYEGLSCERCAKGYTRAVANGGPLINCIPCNCNGRSVSCDPQTGVCSNCRVGTVGDHCEKCMPNLMPPNCDSCMPGFWKISPKGCQPCNCYLPGTINGTSITCDLVTGQCACNVSMNVAGRQCNQCKQNAYNISLGELQCKLCPPCYSPIEQDYISIRHQTDLLQTEIDTLLSNPSLYPSVPLDQSLAVLSVLVRALVTRASTSLINATSLDASWTAMQTDIASLQTALSTTTSSAVTSLLTTTTQLLTSYNQSYASVVSISTQTVSSYNQLIGAVANSVAQQQTAIRQLGVLSNESTVYLGTVQSLSSQASMLQSTALTLVSRSIQIASLAANDSQSYRNMIASLSTSMVSLRNSALLTQSLANEMQSFASAMHRNASAVAAYASQLRNNVTGSLPDNSQAINSISATTASLFTQITSLNSLITSSTRELNGVEQQISTRKQTNSILDSRISTTERRLEAVKSSVSSASSTSASAIASALNTEREAVSILNTVRNFQAVSQQAAADAASALAKVSTATAVVYSANNSTIGINNKISPIQITASQAVAVSSQANQVAQAEKQALDPVYQSALKLKNETSAALTVIQSLNVQQYIDTNVAPLLTRCRNYTTESISLSNNVVSASTQSQLSLQTAQSLATSICCQGNH
ncbi:laminin subunit beta-2-like isoform X2 [Rhopilema esculentum]|uniref:laminin subunit beta-2-like isoform X2 n=1 Tax=Rhopilema esculentum TaxID=499914 RepID=UPI0031D1DCE1